MILLNHINLFINLTMTLSRLFAKTIMKTIDCQIRQCYYKNKDIVLSKNRICITLPRTNRIKNKNKNFKQF